MLHLYRSVRILALAAWLAGCAPLDQGGARTPAPVPAAWPADAAAAAGPAAASVGWQDYYVAPGLRALIRQALLHNTDLRTAVLRVDEARAAFGITRAQQFPAIGLGAAGTVSRVPADLSVTGQPLVSRDYQVALQMNAWELDLWGRVRSLKASALESWLASDAARRAVSLALIAQVADGYLQLRELDERLALARSTIASRAASYKIFQRRYEVGAIAQLDVLQVGTLLTQAEALAAQLEQARALQAHALVQLTGASADQLAAAAPYDDSLVLAPLGAGLPSALLATRPDIAAAEHQLRATRADVDAARAAFYPRISLTAGAGTASAALEGLFKSGSRAWTFAPAVALPLLDGGRNRASLALADVRRELAVVSYDRAVQTAFREVSDALASRRWLARQVDAVQATVTAQHRRAYLATLRYDNGATAYFEVLDAQRDLLAAEQQLVQTRRLLLSSQVALYAALGGGSFASQSTTFNASPKTP
jgi:multidrug efflux system outer membrane protein